MRRGDIVATFGRGDFSTKPRPSLVIQSDVFNSYHPSVTVCPITSHLTGDIFYRIPIVSDETTGLLDDSEIEIDRIQAIWGRHVRQRIGHAPDEVMIAVGEALRLWLDL